MRPQRPHVPRSGQRFRRSLRDVFGVTPPRRLGLVVGQQCARRALPLPAAAAKLAVAAALAAGVMALAGSVSGGRLGNFGNVGVDQTTFGPAVFLWFLVIGGLTVAMSGGIAPRPKTKPAPRPANPVPGPPPVFEEPEFEPAFEPLDDLTEPEPEPEPEFEPEPEPELAPELEPGPEVSRPVAAPVRLDRIPRDLDEDPEAHFITDDDMTSTTEDDVTSDENRGTAD